MFTCITDCDSVGSTKLHIVMHRMGAQVHGWVQRTHMHPHHHCILYNTLKSWTQAGWDALVTQLCHAACMFYEHTSTYPCCMQPANWHILYGIIFPCISYASIIRTFNNFFYFSWIINHEKKWGSAQKNHTNINM